MRNRKREKNDFYKTPKECVEIISDVVENAWDSCAGHNVFQDVLGGKIIKSSDILPKNSSVEKVDFLQVDKKPSGIDMVVVNPPFSKARDFIKKSLELRLPIWALIRLEWLSTKQNRDIQKHCSEIRIVSELIKFETEDGRIVNGNGTMRCAWTKFETKPTSQKKVSWKYYV